MLKLNSVALWPVLLPALLLLTLALARLHERLWSDDLVLTFFDVAQGDSALVRFPGGATLLVDAGGGFGEFDMGSRELFPELARLGVLHLDYGLMTHPDADHAHGFLGILTELKVGQIWANASYGDLLSPHPLVAELARRARASGTAWRKIGLLQEGVFGNTRLRLLPTGAHADKTNNRSLVLLLDFGGCRALLTGDIEASVESRLPEDFARSIEILKVAHHGSRTSSTASFLERARPRWSVVSVGARNRYGHPHPDVLRRLRASGTTVLRTDFHGFVELRISRGGEVRCRTAHGSCGASRCGR